MTDLVSDGGTIGQVLRKLTDTEFTTTADYAWGNAPGAVYVQDTPPTTPIANSLWWDSDSGDLFIRYQDMDSAQWVQINASGNDTSGTVTEAPQDGTPYARQDAGWVPAAAGGGGGLTEPLTLTLMPMTFDAMNAQINYRLGGSVRWVDFFDANGYAFTDGVNNIWLVDHATRVVDFAVTPTAGGAPIVLASAMDAANERIARLEERLARLEGRTP